MQQNSNKGLWAVALIAVVIAIGALFFSFQNTSGAPRAGSVNGGNVTNFTAVQVDKGYWVGANQVLGNLSGISELVLGSSAGSVTQVPSVPACNAASSTLFAVAPPTAATSTVTLLVSAFGGNATTSSLLIGTSTKSTGLASTDVSATLVNSTNGLATSSTNWVQSGDTVNSGNGFMSAGASTVIRILVKPGEFVVGYSTSTATALGSTGYVAGMTTCAPKLLWQS